ncbi:MAG: cytochrome C oxidase assembly protein [Exiguobacterium profundum]|nr:MAG: cytochrome C oxidase assembly protein [Exiguobacterium profundum]
MTFKPTHEMHRRRFSRNLGLGLVLGTFVVLVFALTLVKVTKEGQMQATGAQAATTAGGSNP